MDYIRLLFIEHSALQAIIVLSLISAVGVLLGRIKLCGISLGTAFIFFVGILAGLYSSVCLAGNVWLVLEDAFARLRTKKNG